MNSSLLDIRSTTKSSKIERPSDGFYSNSQNINIGGEVLLTDEYIILNSTQDIPNLSGGIKVYRGGIEPDAIFQWNETLDIWECGLEGNLFPLISLEGTLSNNKIAVVNSTGTAITNNNTFYQSNGSLYCDSIFVGNNEDTIDDSAIMQFDSTSKGVLIPRMTYEQKVAIQTPIDGLTVYDTSLKTFSFYSSADTAWKNVKNEESFLPKTSMIENYRQSINQGSHSGSDIALAPTSVEGFDMSTVNNDYRCFGGSCFDGKYIYMPQYVGSTNNSWVVRCDTTKDLNDTTAYIHFDLKTVDSSLSNIIFSYYDGRYVYFLRDYFNSSLNGYLTTNTYFITRYDTTKDFLTLSSYEKSSILPSFYYQVDLTHRIKISSNFVTCNKIGNYIYFFPYLGFGGQESFDGVNWPESANLAVGLYGSTILRYNTLASFADAQSFELMNTENMSPLVTGKYNTTIGYLSAASDGKYIFFHCSINNIVNYYKYDTTLPFDEANSYTQGIVTTNEFASSLNACKSIYDGKYNYYINADLLSLVRFNTNLDIENTNSFETFNFSSINANYGSYVDLCFDGKYIYLVPGGYFNNETDTYNVTGLLIRYDTTKPFLSSTSYETIDLATVNTNFTGFFSGINAHQYIYLIQEYFGDPVYGEYKGSRIVRFKAYAEDPIHRELGSNINMDWALNTPKITNTASLTVMTETSGDILINAVDRVSIGPTTPNANAAVDIQSTTKAMILPRLTTDIAASAGNNGTIWYSNTSNNIKMCANGAYALVSST